ncbi:MAG: hypothetical protein ACI4P8_01500 [Akkermansia sp.]
MKLHLPSRLRAALLSCMLGVVTIGTTLQAADIISINFGSAALDTGATGSLNGIEAAGWMNITGGSDAVNGTHTLTNQTGQDVGTITLTIPQAPYGPGGATKTTLDGAIQSSYLDLGANNQYTIAIDTNYLLYEVVLYFSGDGNNDANKAFSPVTIDGTTYIGGEDHLAGDNTRWGKREYTTASNSVSYTAEDAAGNTIANPLNTITVTDLFSNGDCTISNVSSGSANIRATLAGMQIIDRSAELQSATVSGSADTNSLTWVPGVEGDGRVLSAIPADQRYLLVTATGSDNSLAFNGESIQTLRLRSGDLTVSGSLQTGTLYADQGTTLTFSGSLSGNPSLIIQGGGTVRLTGSNTVTNLTLKSGNVHLAANASLLVLGNYYNIWEAQLTYDEGASLIAQVAAGQTYTTDNLQFTQNSASNTEVDLLGGVVKLNGDTTSVGITSAGGTLFLSKATGVGSLNLSADSFAITGGTTTISTDEGVNLAITKSTLQIKQGAILNMGNGVNLRLDTTQTAAEGEIAGCLDIKSGTLCLNGGTAIADALIMGNAYGVSSKLIIDDGLLTITGSTTAGMKSGSIRLNHWQSATSLLQVNEGGEFRALDASIGMGDDSGNTTLLIAGGVVNTKGIGSRESTLVKMTGGTLNLGEEGLRTLTSTSTQGSIELTGGTLGTLSANGWSSALNMSIAGATIQTNVYDATTQTLSDTGANITLSGTITASGAGITLAGNGSLTLSHSVRGTLNIEGSGADLIITDVNALDNVAQSYSGYTDAQNGFATYKRAVVLLEEGQTTNIRQVTHGNDVLDVEEDGCITSTSSYDDTTFHINTTVDSAQLSGLVDANKTIAIHAQGILAVTADTSLFGATLSIDNGGQIHISDGATLDLTAASLNRDSQVALVNAGHGSGTLTFSQGNSALEWTSQPNAGPVTVATNVVLTGTGDVHLVGSLGSDISHMTINEGASLTMVSAKLWNKRSTLDVMGSLVAGSLDIGHQEDGDYPGVVNLSGQGSIKTSVITFRNRATTNAFNMSGGTLEFTQNDSSVIAVGDENRHGVVSITGGTLLAESSSWRMSGSANVPVSIGGVTVQTATGKSITLSDITITGTITSEGNLTLGGTADLSDAALANYDVSVLGVTTLPDDGQNGLVGNARVAYIVVDKAGEGSITLSGDNIGSNTDGRTVTQLSTGQYGYVCSEGSLYVIQQADTTLSSLLAEGGAFASGQPRLVMVSDTGSLNLSAGSPAADAATFELLGNGTLVLAEANGTNISLHGATLGDAWTGTVQIASGKLWVGQEIDNYAVVRSTEASTVEFKGLQTCALKTQTVDANIKLTDTVDAFDPQTAEAAHYALKLSNGNSDAVITFNGSVSGSGHMARWFTEGGTQTYTFNGDLSGWTGGFTNNTTGLSSVPTVINLQGKATQINASFHNVIGTFTVNVINDQDVAVAGTFSGNTTSKPFTITTSGTGTKTFSGAITATTLTADSATVLNNITTQVTTINGSGSLTVNQGTLQVGTLAAGLTSSTVNDTTLKVADGTSVLNGTRINGATIAAAGSGMLTLRDVTITKLIDNSASDANSGSGLTLAGAISVEDTHLESWHGDASGEYSDGENGYLLNLTGKVLVNGTATLAEGLTINGIAADDKLREVNDNGSHKVILLDGSGHADDIYRVNTQVSTADTGDAAKFQIAETGTLTLAGTKSLALTAQSKGSIATVADVTYGAMSITGETGCTTTLTGNAAAHFNGTLSLANVSLAGSFAFEQGGTYTEQNVSSTWSDADNNQGFEMIRKDLVLISGGSGSGITVTYKGENATERDGSYLATITTAGSNPTYQQKTGEVTLATIEAAAANKGIATYNISLASGTTLDATSKTGISGQGNEGKFTEFLNTISGSGVVKLNGGEYLATSTAELSFHGLNLNVVGNMALNSWMRSAGSPSNILLGGDTFTADAPNTVAVSGALTLTSHTVMTVQQHAALSVGEAIKLGHDTVANHEGALYVSGGSVSAKSIVLANSNDTTTVNKLVMSSGSLKLTTDAGIGSGVQVTISGGTLDVSAAAWGISNATIGGATIDAGSSSNSLTLQGTTQLTGTLTNNAGTLVLSGEVNLVNPGADNPFDEHTVINGYSAAAADNPTQKQGFAYQDTYYILATDSSKLNTDGVTSWKVNGTDQANGSLDTYGDAAAYKLTGERGTTYYVGAVDGNMQNIHNHATDVGVDLAVIELCGKGLNLNEALGAGESIYVNNPGSSVIDIAGSVSLAASSVTGTSAEKQLKLHGSGTYDIGSATALASGVSLGASWTGTVSMESSTGGDLSALGNANSSIAVTGALSGASVTTASDLSVGGSATLTNGASSAKSFSGTDLTLGAAAVDDTPATSATLDLDGALTLTGTLTLATVGSQVSVGSLGGDLTLSILDALSSDNGTIGTAGNQWTLLTLDNAATGAVVVNGTTLGNTTTQVQGGLNGYWKYTLGWNEDKTVLAIIGVTQNGNTWGGDPDAPADDFSQGVEWKTDSADGNTDVFFSGGGNSGTVNVAVGTGTETAKANNIIINDKVTITDSVTGETSEVGYTFTGGAIVASGSLTVENDAELNVANNTTTADAQVKEGSVLNIVGAGSLTTVGDLQNEGQLVVNGSGQLSVGGELRTDSIELDGSLSASAATISATKLLTIAATDVSLKLTEDAVARLTTGEYTVLSVVDSTGSAELKLDDDSLQSIYKQGLTGNLELVSGGSTFALFSPRTTPDYYILSVAQMTDAQSTWVVGNTTLGADAASEVPMTVLDGNGRLVSEDILDNVRFVKVNNTGNNVIDISGDNAAWDIQLNQVIGQGGLRLVGDAADTIRFSTADNRFTGVVSVQGARTEFHTGSGTTLLLPALEQGQPQVLSDASSMVGGSLGANLTQDAIASGSVQLTTGAALSLQGTSVYLCELPVAGVSTWDVDADSTLTINLGSAGSSATDVQVFLTEGSLLNKYFRVNTVESDGTIRAERNRSYYSDRVAGSGNGAAGIAMADEVLLYGNPQATASDSDLAKLLDTLDACVATGDSAAAERLGEAFSGASVAAMGAALAGTVESRLESIRNRTTTMGVNQCVVNEDMPYFNAWINAEGDYRELNSDGSMPGYKLSSWGGTVGFDVDCTPSFTCGLAFSALYGDFDSKGADHATGDLNTYYLTAFARYAKHRWTHTFVATAGLADTSLERTVNGAKVEGDSDGSMLGALYEVGYVFALDEEATTCLQPVFNVAVTHSTLKGYTESGSTVALQVDDTELTRVSFGLGARLQAVVGESVYNRSSILEMRALLKADAGDREGETKVALAGTELPTHSVKSAESGAIGCELGAGLTVPVGDEGGNLFADASVELRADYTNVNATLGYRVNF